MNTGSILSCSLFIGIAVLIIFLYLRRKKMETGVSLFLKKYAICPTPNEPAIVREALDNKWLCSVGRLPNGAQFYWWQKFTSSISVVNNVAHTTINCFLAISMPPDSMIDGVMERLDILKNEGSAVKDFFVLNTDKPYRAEMLADGSFLIAWQVINSPDVFEKKIEWLIANVKKPKR